LGSILPGNLTGNALSLSANVIPLGMTPEELRAGFIRVMGTCYGSEICKLPIM
jgi:hypothetical protein